MSLCQDTAPPTLPTTTDIKRRIKDNEHTTQQALAVIYRRLDSRARLRRRLDYLIDCAVTARGRRTFREVLADFFHGGRVSEKRRRDIQHAGRSVLQEMHLLHSSLKDQGYCKVDERTQAHYDDIKALTLLDIKGDAEVDEFHERSISAISLLRHAQREIESLRSMEQEDSRFEEGTRE